MIVQTWQHYKGEATNYTVDWGVKVGRLSTSVSSVVWTAESGSAVISSEALASNIASATITTGSEDCSLIKLAATLADGQIDVYFFKVKALDPTCAPASSGRY